MKKGGPKTAQQKPYNQELCFNPLECHPDEKQGCRKNLILQGKFYTFKYYKIKIDRCFVDAILAPVAKEPSAWMYSQIFSKKIVRKVKLMFVVKMRRF